MYLVPRRRARFGFTLRRLVDHNFLQYLHCLDLDSQLPRSGVHHDQLQMGVLCVWDLLMDHLGYEHAQREP